MSNVVKNLNGLVLALAGSLVLLTGCVVDQHAMSGRKFHEEDAADLIIRYSSDNTIFRLKPDAHDGPFYRIFSRQELCDLDAQRVGARNLAVVVMGYSPFVEVERQIKQGWVDNLTRLNYRHVVFLRATEKYKVNGLRVVDEVDLSAPRSTRIDGEFDRNQASILTAR